MFHLIPQLRSLRCPVIIFAGMFILFLCPFSLQAQVNGPGTTGANYEKIGMGARAAGMGEAFTAVADDATAMYWNPAGLVLARGTQFSLTHSEWLQGVTDEYFAFSQNLQRDGAFGGSLQYLGTGTFAGSLEDSQGNYAGVGNNISASSYIGTAAYAQRLGNWFAGDIFRASIVGIEISALGQNVSNVGNSGVAFNIGYIFEAIHRTLFATIVVTDLGSDIQTFAEPLNANLGGSLQLRNFLLKDDQNILALDADGYIDTGFGFKLGDEYRLNFGRNGVALRAGYRAGASLDTVTNLTMGVGLYHKFDDFDAGLDYAYVPYGILGDTHRITLNIIVGGNPIPPRVWAAPMSGNAFVLGPDKMLIKISAKSESPITKWKINILDGSGTLVRTISGKGYPPSRYEWDGKNKDGELVPQGDYSVNVEVTDDEDLTGRAIPAAVNAKWVPKKVPFAYTYGVSGDLLFDSGKPDLLQRGYDAIQQVVTQIRKRFPNSVIQIAGHTDNVKVAPHATFKDNQELSLLRAQSVMAYLIKSGMNPNLLGAVGYGDTKPIAPNDTPENRAKNRRVELVVSGTIEVTADELIGEGQKLMTAKDYKGALTDFLKAVESDSRNAKAYHLAGDCYLILGGKDLAVQAYVKSLKYDPDNKALRDWLTQYAPEALAAPAPSSEVKPDVKGGRTVQDAPPSSAPAAGPTPGMPGMPALP